MAECFHDVHEMIQIEHAFYAQDPNPVKTILQYNNGYYFLPVFYTLCRHLNTNSHKLAQEMYKLVDVEFHPLLKRIQILDPKITSSTAKNLTRNTLHFCANNLYEKSESMKQKFKLIVRNNQRAILSVKTPDQMVELVRNIQQRHFPISNLKLRNTLKKPSRYIWNFLTESWQEAVTIGEISNHIVNLWYHIKTFLIQYKQSGGVGGPDDVVVEKFNTVPINSSIISDTSLERIDTQMDTHIWLIRMTDGALDLLTGHTGGVVPEFYLSDRKCGIPISRLALMNLLQNSPNLVALYHLLIDKTFFLQYLKNLFMDASEDLYSPLCNLVSKKISDIEQHPQAVSMMKFYTHLCKYISFEYDMIMYLLHVLSSVMAATNYERNFFVFRGYNEG